MDRQIVYPGAIPLETDILNTNKNAMVGLSKLASAMLGTSTILNGFACSPDSPASLNVSIAPGEIYSLQNIDSTAYSSLAADTAHSILKQGISLNAVLLTCAAPVTAGQSINYLIQIAYQDTDTNAVVLPYYNASNPSLAYSGPANAGTTNNTVRKGAVAISAKAGATATTGTQTTPAADSGYVGIAVVTVANGATTIVSGNIGVYASKPTLPYNLNQIANGLGSSFATSGYQKLPSGLIVQWGAFLGNAGSDTTLTYPIAFPNAVYAISGTTTSGSNSDASIFSVQIAGLSSVPASVWNNSGTRVSRTCSYIAIGY